jgi:hypothetical protein
LVPPLHRTLALAKVHHVPGAIPKDLHFDVSGACNVLFEKDGRLFEEGSAFDAGGFEIVAQLSLV